MATHLESASVFLDLPRWRSLARIQQSRKGLAVVVQILLVYPTRPFQQYQLPMQYHAIRLLRQSATVRCSNLYYGSITAKAVPLHQLFQHKTKQNPKKPIRHIHNQVAPNQSVDAPTRH